MLSNLKRREGFTLIELMIVVAIIGILAAIAIPNFIKFQLRSKAGEGKVNLAAIRTAQESYFADAGQYLDWAETPAALGGQSKVPFLAIGTSCTTIYANPLPQFAAGDLGFCWIGWQPEGDVYYTYQVIAALNGAPGIAPVPPQNGFFAAAVADIDGDTNLNSWGVNQPDITGNPVAGAGFTTAQCGDALLGPVGVDNAGVKVPVLGQVAPCAEVDMGRNIF